MAKKGTSVDFGKGSVAGLIIRQALPLMLSSFVQLLYNIVDRIYIGHIPGEGTDALTGLGLTFPIVSAILAFTMLFGHANDIYMQISLIMLIGLLAKNAILIVQFALERRQTGMAISWSAVLGAAARLRPILMTSLAMVIGLLPMMFASGVGKNGNQTLGAAAVGGMLIGTILQLFVVPTLFVIFQTLQEKISPLKFEDEENAEVAAELEQYAHSEPVTYELEK